MRLRKLKAWHIALGVVGLFGFGGLGLVGVLDYRAHQEVDQALSRLRKLNMPTEFSEVLRTIPAETNAAPLYVQAAALTAKLKLHRNSPFSNDHRTVDYEALRMDVTASQPVLEILDQATLKPDCEFGLTDNPRQMVPESLTWRLRVFVDFYAFHARIASHDGNFTLAHGALRKAATVMSHTHEPSFTGVWTRFQEEGIWLNELDKEIEEHGEQAAFRRSATKLLHQLPPLPTARDAFKLEIPLMRHLFTNLNRYRVAATASDEDDIRFSDDSPFNSTDTNYLVRYDFIRTAALASSLHAWADGLEMMQADPKDWRLVDKAEQAIGSRLMRDFSLGGRLALQFVDAPSGIGRSVGKLLARRRMIEVALKLYEAHSQEAVFPAALPGKSLLDPYSDRPFVYGRRGKGFLLYSVGPNGSDDGGPRLVTGKRTDDLVFAGTWHR